MTSHDLSRATVQQLQRLQRQPIPSPREQWRAAAETSETAQRVPTEPGELGN